jgi:hypothetical protein
MSDIPMDASPPYDPAAIFHQDGPIDPVFMDEAIRTLMRTMPLDAKEPRAWAFRRMHSAMRALAALHPRDEIEIMLGVQALSAYQAASACWRIGMNLRQPSGDSTRHITTAATAARTFDTLLRAIERRQAKPLAVPVGRPPCQPWPRPDLPGLARDWEARCRGDEPDTTLGAHAAPDAFACWTPKQLAIADAIRDQDRIEAENHGLDIADTEGILPGGGMIMPEDPSPQQAAYIGRRLGLMYKRQYHQSLRQGAGEIPKLRPVRPGDHIP